MALLLLSSHLMCLRSRQQVKRKERDDVVEAKKKKKRKGKSSFSRANKEPCMLNLFAFLFVYHTYLRDIFEHAKIFHQTKIFCSIFFSLSCFLPIQIFYFYTGLMEKRFPYDGREFEKRINFYGEIFK